MPHTTPTSSATAPRISIFEQTFGSFYDRTIAAAAAEQPMTASLMRELNTVCTVVAGLGQVMRIVTGNGVLEDNHDPEDPNSQPPLSRVAESQLTAMVGAVCEMLCDSIESRADPYNKRVKA